MPASKYSIDLQDTICAHIEQGVSPPSAARISGVSERTHYNWMARGEEERGDEYVQYVQAIKMARSQAEAFHVEVVRKAGADGKWQASAWWLERTMPEKYGKKEVSTDDALKVLLKALLAGDEKIVRQLQAAVKQAASVPSA